MPEALIPTSSKDPGAGKRRLAGDTAPAATTDEVKEQRQEARTKEVVAKQTLELRLLKRRMIEGGDSPE